MKLIRAATLGAASLTMLLAHPAFAQAAGPQIALEDVSPGEATNIHFDTAADATETALSGGQNIIAEQVLASIISNVTPGSAVIDQSLGGGQFRTGDNIISGNAFGAFSGILTQSMNTGVNANSQAATNVAATGFTASQTL